MARKKKVSGPGRTNEIRKSTRRQASGGDVVPAVYQEMIDEAGSSTLASDVNRRPTKRRRISSESQAETKLDVELRTSPQPGVVPADSEVSSEIALQPKLHQIFFNDESEDSDESDVEFEDVELVLEAKEEAVSDSKGTTEPKSLEINLSKPIASPLTRRIQRRKPITKAERVFRLNVHKWHVLCLLGHLATRNLWCNREAIQERLKPLITRKTIALLHPGESMSEFQQHRSFMKGIEEVCALWRGRWEVTARGARRARWREKLDMAKELDNAEDEIDFEDFLHATKSASGSRDLGAQLFCALLRSVAVDCRLVCSLQVLPFSGVGSNGEAEKQTNLSASKYVQATAQDYGGSGIDKESTLSTSPRKKKAQRIIDSPYPVFWVEVLNPVTTRWMPLDPIVRDTINKPRTGFEPPASDTLNAMSYVIAFEEEGYAKDVTRRYAEWYNAKTSKSRVESTKDGQAWWNRTMKFYHKILIEPRDEDEYLELRQRSLAEGMPKNVQDFKNHPVYVLERHIRANEIIHPRRECGKMSTGSGRNTKLESVFRRDDVHICRSADAWYRRGRDVKAGEQAPKRMLPKRNTGGGFEGGGIEGDDDDATEAQAGIALYMEDQTDLYEPPPVTKGKVPKNAYGNLDVYVPTMIPMGGVHLKHPVAAEAAKLLGISFADAVTGFSFKGRQGTAVLDGVIVDAQCTAAMIEVVKGLEDQRIEVVTIAREAIILSVWRRMLTALQVRQKIQREYGEETRDRNADEDDDDDSTYNEDGGGFMVEAISANEETKKQESAMLTTNIKDRLPTTLPDLPVSRPLVVTLSPHKPMISMEEELFGSEFDDEVIVCENERQYNVRNDIHPTDDDDNQPGGFLQELDHDPSPRGRESANTPEAGGFVIDGEEDIDSQSRQIQESANPLDTLESGGFVTPSSPVADDETEREGGFLVDDADEQHGEHPQMPSTTTTLQEQNDSERVDRGTSEVSTIRVAQDRNREKNVNLHTRIPVPKMNDGNTDEGKGNGGAESEDSLSRPSSLLSHDPAEDDAEPEWLDDALED